MKRREVLKIISLAGAAGLLGGVGWLWPRSARAWVLITDRPRLDIARLRRALGRSAKALELHYAPVEAASQDVTLIRHGRVIDPSEETTVPEGIVHLVAEMRRRSAPGHTMVILQTPVSDPAPRADVRVDGTLLLQLDPKKNYNRIEVPGRVGKTVLKWRDGRIQVVEAGCRHKLCQKMGAMEQGQLICAPNRLLVTLPPLPYDALVG